MIPGSAVQLLAEVLKHLHAYIKIAEAAKAGVEWIAEGFAEARQESLRASPPEPARPPSRQEPVTLPLTVPDQQPAPQPRAEELEAQRQKAHQDLIRSIERAAAATGRSVDGFLYWLQSLPYLPPRTTVGCPRCGTRFQHLGNQGQYRCAGCGAQLVARRCTSCAQWLSHPSDQVSDQLFGFRCEECRAADRRSSYISLESITEAEYQQLYHRLERLLSSLSMTHDIPVSDARYRTAEQELRDRHS